MQMIIVFGRKTTNYADAGPRQPRSHNGREEAQQQTFSEHLPNQPRPSRPQGDSNGNFLFAAGRSRQQEIRNVRARDQKDEGYRELKYDNGAAHHCADILYEQRKYTDSESF